jgi:cob(I)alamin adenosyltransferase
MVTKIKKAVVVEGNDDRSSLGLLHVYTGDGKGKTSASLGLAIRAVGRGLRVCMIQFLKTGETGEFYSIKKYFPNKMEIIPYGAEAVKERQVRITEFSEKTKDKGPTKFKFLPDTLEKDAAQMGMLQAIHSLKNEECDILILDEINVVLDKGILTLHDFKEMLSYRGKIEIVCTGRDAPKEIMDMADYVTKFENIKHPWQKGIVARRGIDY